VQSTGLASGFSVAEGGNNNKNQFGSHISRKDNFLSKDTSRNIKKKLSGASDEASELLSEAFENPESTPVHLNKTKFMEDDEKSEIIRKAIGELDSKDSAMLSNPFQVGKDRRETRC